MPNEDDVINRKLVRQARPPAQGASLNEVGAGRVNDSFAQDTTIVDSDGKVRRRWQPGDPWSDDYYFGSKL